MNNEFTKITQDNITRYILESDSGTTTAGSVATVPGALGKVRKRGDNILAQEADKKTVPVSTPRNFVAKNAKTGGAGAHKDKKKAEKQGDVKHRKPFAEQGVAEGLNEFAPPERGDGQENRFNFIEEFESDDGKYVIELYRNVESRSFAVSFHRDNMQYVMYPIDGIDAGDLADGADRYVKEIKKNAAHGSQEDFVALGSTDLEVFIPPEQGVAEGFNGEYDDEAGMAQSNLITTARAVMGLLKTIKDRDNLPEWGQEKIAKAEMMLVSVWDYLQSQKAMGNDPQQDMAEGERTMSRAAKGYEKYGKKGMQALAKAGRDDASDEKLNTIRNKHNKYNEGEDPYFESLRARVEELAKK